MTDLKSIAKALEHVRAVYGRLDILINDSGISNLDGDLNHPAILTSSST